MQAFELRKFAPELSLALALATRHRLMVIQSFGWQHLQRSALFASLIFASAPGCGPSLEVMNENNIRFEHCYRLDWDQRVVDAERLGCWQNWRRFYSQGHSFDRVRYADERIQLIQSGRSQTYQAVPSTVARDLPAKSLAPAAAPGGGIGAGAPPAPPSPGPGTPAP